VLVPSVIPALGRQRQEDLKFEASLDYIVSSRPAWAMSQNTGILEFDLH
jgi:hypothetical protein